MWLASSGQTASMNSLITDKGPLFDYRERVSEGLLEPDPAHALLAEKMQSLFRALSGFTPQAGHTGWRERLGLGRANRIEAPQGLYIYGPVGAGKSMLMDLFFASAPVAKKRRVHFHEFLLEVHERFDRFRKSKGA